MLPYGKSCALRYAYAKLSMTTLDQLFCGLLLVIGILAWNASLMAPLDKSSLVLVLLFSAIFLKEQLTLQVILGTGLIVVGTLVLIR